jgi:hypothetical protein
MALALELSSLLSANTKATASQDKVASSVVDIGNIMGEATGNITRINNELSAAERTIQEQAIAVTKKQEAAKATAASDFFLNPDAVGYRAKELGQTIATAYDNKQKALETIQAKQSVSFIDNPLGYIVAQLSVDSDIEQYNAESRRGAAASQMMTELETGYRQAANGALGSISTISDASANASIIKAGSAGAIAAQEAIRQGGRDNLQHIIAISETDLKKAQIAGNTFSAQAQMLQIQNAQESLRMQRETFEMHKKDRLDKEQATAVDSKLVQQGYFALKGKQMPAELVKTIPTFMDKKDPEYQEYYKAGRASYLADPTGQSTVISDSPFDVLTLTRTGVVKNLNPAMTATVSKLDGLWQEYTNPAVQSTRKLVDKSKDALEKDFNAWLSDRLKAERANVTSGSIYAPLPLADVAKAVPAVANSPVWQKVLAPLVGTGAKLDDPGFVMQQLEWAIRDGKITMPDATEVAAVYKKAMDLTGASRNYMAFGITPSLTYNTMVNGKLVNIADTKDVTRLFMYSANRTGLLTGKVGGGAPGPTISEIMQGRESGPTYINNIGQPTTWMGGSK